MIGRCRDWVVLRDISLIMKNYIGKMENQFEDEIGNEDRIG